MWFDHVEHMEEGPEQNKEWENFWWTVDEDLFTYVMKTKIEELIEEKLNQEFPEEVEIREDPDYDSEEEMTSETEDTDDDESETNNANVNNYLDSANVVTNLETATKIAEEEDLWIGDSGASSHMMEILNMCPASVQVKILKRMTGNQLPNELKRSQKMMLRV